MPSPRLTSGIMNKYDNDFIYTGPSWAVQSYSTPLGNDGVGNTINIGDLFAKEFNHSLGSYREAWLPAHGVGNKKCCEEIRRWGHVDGWKPIKPIIWVLCDPFARLYYNTLKNEMCWPHYKEDEIVFKHVKVEHFLNTFFKSKDYLEERKKLLHADLEDMNNLGMPIGILGAHSDIDYEDVEPYENITVLEPSWQKVLCNHSGVRPMEPNWGADFVHQTLKMYLKEDKIMSFMKENKIDKYTWKDNIFTRKLMDFVMDTVIGRSDGIEPTLVQHVHGQYECWRQLELKGLFNWVHPSITGNLVFYEHVKHKMEKFVNAHKE